MDIIIRLFLRLKSFFHTYVNINISNDMTVPGVITPYGKMVYFSSEEKKIFVKSLTAWEMDVYLLLLEGYTVMEISHKLHIGYIVANKYQKSICRKLKINTRSEIIMNYRDIGAG
ncbi:MAG: LuxR C-terminal-related transcriptional regulator [Sedimentibacter sp.]|uniref:helix-turn-helix transcriptional regulator n=1 Tax=Sedimentibacter sp. TaxID=1960295 RepID=UPI0029813729|nr:LuxR C-terminal-related transcriptional regulator [Sedimentibacter sp.]MDW5299310.1 LuxR C-terminal-related transcriptional regulator [Sedimentibacter sp.]